MFAANVTSYWNIAHSGFLKKGRGAIIVSIGELQEGERLVMPPAKYETAQELLRLRNELINSTVAQYDPNNQYVGITTRPAGSYFSVNILLMPGSQATLDYIQKN